MNYYTQKQQVALVDKKNTVTGSVEKWEAHQKGLLHRAFTVCLFYRDHVLLQHRKHPVFDGVYDLTCSSHPIFHNGKLEDVQEAALSTLMREWSVKKNELQGQLRQKGSIYYKAKDPRSKYVEHEVCHLLVGNLRKLPLPNFQVAYGYSLITKKELMQEHTPVRKMLAPWVLKLLSILD